MINHGLRALRMFTYAPELETRLKTLQGKLSQVSVLKMLEEEPARAEALSFEVGDLFCDLSKHRVNREVMQALMELAEQAKLPDAIEAMFTGKNINTSESRPAWHVALRDPDLQAQDYQGKPLKLLIEPQMDKMREWVANIHSGIWRGATGKSFTDIINLGIGGSDLGPRMATHALQAFHTGHLKVHFVSNVDGLDLLGCLKDKNPETTLFVIASKSFTTQETLLNAQTVRSWLQSHMGSSGDVSAHLIAITSQPERAVQFGVSPELILEMWDFIGGRYSTWSTIGFPLALAIGMDRFEEMLSGGREMDQHFRHTPFFENLPVLLGLLGIWYRNFWKWEMHALLPYDERFQGFLPYLQQVEMESLGKSLNIYGEPVNGPTGPVIWGGVGTHGQHAFHQLLFQGTVPMSLDFIAVKTSSQSDPQHHRVLLANAVAQAEALMVGRAKANTQNVHQEIIGNIPSTFLVLEQLTPHSLGMLMALYEHKVYVQSVLWEINAFDQWGVELGKHLVGAILSKDQDHDPSTMQLCKKLNLR